MASISRGPKGPYLKDNDGKYIALSFTTKTVDIRVSNKVVAILCTSGLAVCGFGASVGPTAAQVFGWALRLTHLN